MIVARLFDCLVCSSVGWFVVVVLRLPGCVLIVLPVCCVDGVRFFVCVDVRLRVCFVACFLRLYVLCVCLVVGCDGLCVFCGACAYCVLCVAPLYIVVCGCVLVCLCVLRGCAFVSSCGCEFVCLLVVLVCAFVFWFVCLYMGGLVRLCD